MSKPATPKMSLLADIFESGQVQYSISNGDGIYDSISEENFFKFLHGHKSTPAIPQFRDIVDEAGKDIQTLEALNS